MHVTPKPETSVRGHRGPALLDAARRLFFTKGYAGTTVEQVAADAGFSKRTVYLYFKNKDDLFAAIAEEGLEILRSRLDVIDVDALPVKESIQRILDVYLWFAKEHTSYFHIIFREAEPKMIRGISDELRRRLENHENACVGLIVRVAQKAIDEELIPAIDPWAVAVAFWGLVTGILLLSMGGVQTVFAGKSREELIEKAVWLFYSGLLVAPENPGVKKSQTAGKKRVKK